MNILLVALGGAMGAITRYLITSFSDNLLYYQLPLGTLIVNILGCFAAGCVVGFFGTKVTDLYLFFVIGFLGSFTTMSAFSLQTMELYQSNNVLGLIYIILTFTLTIVATYVGWQIFSHD